MDAHPDRDIEALLQALLTGERDERDAEVQGLFAANPALRERYDRLQRLAGDLECIGVADRAVRTEAANLRLPPDAAIARLVERRLRPAHRFPRWLIAAAALLVAALAILWSQRQRAADENSTLGPGRAAERDMQPVGPVSDYTTFHWNLPLPPGWVYVVRFHDGDPDGRILLQRELTDTQWRPGADDRRRLTARMAWEVDLKDLGGSIRGGVGPAMVYLQR